MSKSWYRSKTLWFNAAVLALAYVIDQSDAYVNPLWFLWLNAAVNIGLRAVTRAALSTGEPS